jgi:hypothetical protein
MEKKEKIFIQKKKFNLKYSILQEYQFQENDDKGELINEEGVVVAQIWDIESFSHGFVVAALFMGEPIFKLVYYDRVIILDEQIGTASTLAHQALD